jgi:ribonuclease J
MRPGELVFVPLGGSGEIGMNLNLYGHAGRWLMIDCGITFDSTSGTTQVVLPDPEFIAQRRDALLGLVVTHVHEDHLGAIAQLWTRLRCPVFATPFPAEILRRKLHDVGLLGRVPLHEIPTAGRLSLPPFELRFVGVTHSTVESSAIIIETPLGTVLHTGDFKLDPEPLVGPVTDAAVLRACGERGVLAAISDSTNATKEGSSRSEGELRSGLVELLGRFERRIAVACFASNIARIATFIDAAQQLDRHPIIVGRSLLRMIDAARRTGYLPRFPTEVAPREIGYLPPGKVMLICTGTQGEPGAALSRISNQAHRDVFLERDDAAVFSSKIIPGNEDPIEALHQRLRRSGVRVVDEHDAFVHVSGHPARDELRELYGWTRPRIVVPVHGEQRHMQAHAELAIACGVPESLVPFNGAVVRLAPGPAAIIGRVHAGRLRLEGDRLVPVSRGA